MINRLFYPLPEGRGLRSMRFDCIFLWIRPLIPTLRITAFDVVIIQFLYLCEHQPLRRDDAPFDPSVKAIPQSQNMKSLRSTLPELIMDIGELILSHFEALYWCELSYWNRWSWRRNTCSEQIGIGSPEFGISDRHKPELVSGLRRNAHLIITNRFYSPPSCI